MIISGSGAQGDINWPGGDGTIAISEIVAAMQLGSPAGQTGDIGTAVVRFEASFNGGNTYQTMTRDSVPVEFSAATILAQNFSASACKIRANIVSGTVTGIGALLGINGRGQ